VPPEALGEDACRLDGRREVEIVEPRKWTNRDPPRPAVFLRIVLWIAADLDHGKEHLPHRRVTDGDIAVLDGRPACRRVRPEPLRIHIAFERTVACAADEQPVLGEIVSGYSRSTMPAIAMPKPTHIEAIP
jgi:hypothetical protein